MASGSLVWAPHSIFVVDEFAEQVPFGCVLRLTTQYTKITFYHVFLHPLFHVFLEADRVWVAEPEAVALVSLVAQLSRAVAEPEAVALASLVA